MKIFKLLLSAVFVCACFVSIAQANSLCQGKEGMWISQPAQDPNFGNYFLGGMCDDNSCYHITVSDNGNGDKFLALTFTCEEIGDGSERIQWVFVDVESGQKHEFKANLAEVNEILRETLNQ